MRNMRLIPILLFISYLIPLGSWAQSSAFILIDVSASGPKYGKDRVKIRLDAREMAKDIVLGQYKPAKYDRDWKWSNTVPPRFKEIQEGRGKPLIDTNQDGYVMIMPFGERPRYRDFQIEKLDKISDFEPFFNKHYPIAFKDLYTYDKIARAKAAGVAKSNQVNINSYYLIVISDELRDTGSKPPKYNSVEQNLIDDYGTASTTETKIATIRYSGTENHNFNVVIAKVNVSKLNINPTTINPTNVGKKKLTIIKPKGSSKNPTEIELGKQASVVWQCLGCGDSVRYTVKLTNLDNKKIRSTKRTSGLNQRFDIEETGKYKITIGGAGLSKSTYLIASRGGGGDMLFILLVLAGLFGGAYFMMNKRREQQMTGSTQNTGGSRWQKNDNNQQDNNNFFDNNSYQNPNNNTDTNNGNDGDYF